MDDRACLLQTLIQNIMKSLPLMVMYLLYVSAQLGSILCKLKSDNILRQDPSSGDIPQPIFN